MFLSLATFTPQFHLGVCSTFSNCIILQDLFLHHHPPLRLPSHVSFFLLYIYFPSLLYLPRLHSSVTGNVPSSTSSRDLVCLWHRSYLAPITIHPKTSSSTAPAGSSTWMMANDSVRLALRWLGNGPWSAEAQIWKAIWRFFMKMFWKSGVAVKESVICRNYM